MQTHKLSFRKTLLATGIAAAIASPLGWADSEATSFSTQTQSSIKKEKHVAKDVHVTKQNSTTKQVDYAGEVSIDGAMRIKSTAQALVDNEQFSVGNSTDNERTESSANVGNADDSESGAFQDASGNIGANVAGGTGNQQDNATALAVSDASWVFGGEAEGDSSTQNGVHADATAMVDQESAGNTTSNTGSSNESGLDGNAFSGASGNIGANAAAGTGNQQKNNLAVAVMQGEAVLTEATVSTLQNSHGNTVSNLPACDCTPSTNSATVAGNAFQGASGNIGVNVASGTGNQQSNSLAISGSDI